ncbi:hypothetical protein BM536_008220 [Streptomyces phaeoluteigriseus]|uniref:Uncharacterized protein n=1 Tax=Streptomyces phaeoluteigriseus TaxID=114686 RepID=A0A1V6MVG9_9ACTN|nr:hypothetical protein BM536_008220 [Streptomyces phaeoluteigriseus]
MVLAEELNSSCQTIRGGSAGSGGSGTGGFGVHWDDHDTVSVQLDGATVSPRRVEVHLDAATKPPATAVHQQPPGLLGF